MQSKKMYCPYAKYQAFAPALSDSLKTDTDGWSIATVQGTELDIGPNYQLYGPQSESSQLYMAEKCSRNWDGFCEALANNRAPSKTDMANIIPKVNRSMSETVADSFIDNASQRRFCDLSDCSIFTQNYNPLDPTSAPVKSYKVNGPISCKPLDNPDNDILLNRILDSPEQHIDLLLNMYRTCKSTLDKYKGTRIGKAFDLIGKYEQIYGSKL